MFTAGTILVGVVAGWIVGVSKTGFPGAGIVAIPLFATVFEGRLIPGGTLPVLLVADLFAIAWYRRHARWDLLRPLMASIAAGFVAGIAFFVVSEGDSRQIEVLIGAIVLVVVGIQVVRLVRGSQPGRADPVTAAAYGGIGGFTTFVANAAGPIINTYLVGLRLPKQQYLGTSAWFYLAVNAAKIPIYLALGALTAGGPFFTGASVAYAAMLVPAVVAGAHNGRWLVERVSQPMFVGAILAMSTIGALNLIV